MASECWFAIEFECDQCSAIQTCDDTLELQQHEDGDRMVKADIIDCSSCGKENFVFVDL